MTPADGVLAATREAVPGVSVFDSIVPDQPSATRWVVVYPDTGRFTALGLCGSGESGVLAWYVNCFAPSREQAEWLAARVEQRYRTGWISTAGWGASSPEEHIPAVARADESVRSVPLVVCSAYYSMTITKV